MNIDQPGHVANEQNEKKKKLLNELFQLIVQRW